MTIDIDHLEACAKQVPTPMDRLDAAVWGRTFSPATILTLIAELRALREDLQATKLLAHANAEMFKAEKAENEGLRVEIDNLEKSLADCREAAFSEDSENPFLAGAVGCPQEVPSFVEWEMKRLREALSTPQYTHLQHTDWTGSGADGLHPKAVEEAFMHCARSVTIYYGQKRVYTSMAEFCAAHPREKS